MASLEQLLKQADDIIEKIASEKVVEKPVDQEDEIFKLASQVRSFKSQAPVAAPTEFEWTEEEKTACSLAVMETWASAKEILALQKFEKAAAEKGMSDSDIQRFFDKFAASSDAGRRVFDFMTGAGEALQQYAHSIPKGVDLFTPKGKGQVLGALLPLLGAGGVGAYYGSKKKEEAMKQQFGMR